MNTAYNFEEEEKIRELIQNIRNSNNKSRTTISTFLTAFQSSKYFRPLPNLPMFSVLPIILTFSDSVSRLENPTLASLSQQVDRISDKEKLKQMIRQIKDDLPNTKERKKLLSKSQRTELKSIYQSLNFNEISFLTISLTFFQQWYSFWDFTCGLKSVNSQTKSICRSCKTVFELVDPHERLKSIREQYKKEITLLKNHIEKWELKIVETMPLYEVIKGSIISGSMNCPIEKDALLFFFEERLYVYQSQREKVESQLNCNIWMNRSLIFPQNNIVDILGTDFSFAFRPIDSKSKEMMWRNWNSLKSDRPLDFSLFQPIKLDDLADDEFERIDFYD